MQGNPFLDLLGRLDLIAQHHGSDVFTPGWYLLFISLHHLP
jgi:hypothetical protein